jgi:hypothetical protein
LLLPVLGVDLREREEVEVLERLGLEVLADERAEQVHRRVVVERPRGLLPGAAERALLVVGSSSRHVSKTDLTSELSHAPSPAISDLWKS